jgi:hypothetical protein
MTRNPDADSRRKRSAGWAEYGYCASHSRFFWGLRLHLLCTLHGLPVGFALTGAKADERQTLLGILHADPDLITGRAGQITFHIAASPVPTAPRCRRTWTSRGPRRRAMSWRRSTVCRS